MDKDLDGIEEKKEEPKGLFERYPELKTIKKAFEQHFNGEKVTVCCPKCNRPLLVLEVPGIGSLRVLCKNGCVKHGID